MNSNKWELYEIIDVPTGVKVAGRETFKHIGKFRRMEKNVKTLQFEYFYQDKELKPKDFYRWRNSKNRLDYWEYQAQNAKKQAKRLKSFHRQMRYFLGLKYMTDYKPPRTRTRGQKYKN